MLEDFANAFVHFRKATKLYEKIGDTVSYSYTLWGFSAAYIMLGKYGRASDFLSKAIVNFNHTKDPRGIIYCNLGRGQIALLAGKKALAKRRLSSALNESKKNNFAVEKCHAETLIALADGMGYSEKFGSTCYDRLGLKLGFKRLPLNIP